MDEIVKSKSQSDYIKEYQRKKYINDPLYRAKVLEKNKKNYNDKYKNDEDFKLKIKANNKLYYEKTKQMKQRLQLLENDIKKNDYI